MSAMVGSTAGDGYGDIDAQVAAARERAERSGAWVGEMEQLTGHGSALRGGVTVEVDLGGTVVGLGITDAAAGYGGQTVAGAVLEAHTQAQQDLRRRAEASTAAAWGAGSATTAAVTDEVERLTPGADPDSPDDAPRPAGGAW